jgi:spore maturation protein CgeB
MKILFLGPSSGTSLHRADALVRLGHEVVLKNPYNELSTLSRNRWLGVFHFQTGYRLLQPFVCAWLKKISIMKSYFDLVWVDGGELFGRDALLTIKSLGIPIVLHNHDDPTGSRDGRRFDSLKNSLHLYDLITAVRVESEKELLKYSSGKVLRIWRTYDEVSHNPDQLNQTISSNFVSDVCFIGTWMRYENRDKFLLDLVDQGIHIAIWGERWQKSYFWHQLQLYWRGPTLTGADYVSAIQGAKICLGLLSKGNRDLHTTRTMEIPYAGGLLCAERTTEHLELYKEDKEAVFWSDVNECANKCRDLLANSKKREQIRLAGMKRVRENKVGNEDICRQIISAVFS